MAWSQLQSDGKITAAEGVALLELAQGYTFVCDYNLGKALKRLSNAENAVASGNTDTDELLKSMAQLGQVFMHCEERHFERAWETVELVQALCEKLDVS